MPLPECGCLISQTQKTRKRVACVKIKAMKVPAQIHKLSRCLQNLHKMSFRFYFFLPPLNFFIFLSSLGRMSIKIVSKIAFLPRGKMPKSSLEASLFVLWPSALNNPSSISPSYHRSTYVKPLSDLPSSVSHKKELPARKNSGR